MFCHRLAAAFGTWDVDKLLSEIPSPCLHRWMMYFQIDPPADMKEDVRHALLSYYVVRSWGGAKNKGPKDFMIPWDEKQVKPKMTLEEAKHTAMRLNAMMGGSFS